MVKISSKLDLHRCEGTGVTQAQLLDEPPSSDALTPYDRVHMKLYLRLLDAETDGGDWKEVVKLLFGMNPSDDPARAELMHRTHLARARWMAQHGYRQLARESQS
jgi:Uncharacterized conserved protein (DUF2285)